MPAGTTGSWKLRVLSATTRRIAIAGGGDMPEQAKPLPCPFVQDGHKMWDPPEINNGGVEAHPFRVGCWCGAQGPCERTEQEAIAAWNRRAPSREDEVRAEALASFREWVRELRHTTAISQAANCYYFLEADLNKRIDAAMRAEAKGWGRG